MSLQEEIGQLSEDLRSISHAMMPAILVHGDFLQAINGLINREYQGVNIDWKIDNQMDPGIQLKKEVQHTLYRIIQEAISNSYKHGEAQYISLSINKEGYYITMTYTDNGKGFNPNNIKPGLGLSNIQQRVQALNGQTKIHSAPNQGFKMDLRFPFHEVSN